MPERLDALARAGRPSKNNLLSAFYLRMSAAKFFFVCRIQRGTMAFPFKTFEDTPKVTDFR